MKIGERFETSADKSKLTKFANLTITYPKFLIRNI